MTEENARGEPSPEVDALASRVIEAAIEVHRVLGPGFLENVYQAALEVEMFLRGIPFVRQVPMALAYKGRDIGDFRLDLLVGGRLVVELKAVDHVAPIHMAQALSYLKATNLSLGLIVNFNVPVLLRGVRRVVLRPKP